MNYSEDLFVFVHIPKTAGSSFNRILSSIYGDYLFNGLLIDPSRVFEKLKCLTVEEKAQVKAFTAHCEYNSVHPFFPDRKIALTTLIREPISRIISYIRYIQQAPTHRHHLLLNGKDLEESLDALIDKGEAEIKNHQCFSVSGIPKFDTAQASIEDNFRIIGTTDNFLQFVETCSYQFDWDISTIDFEKKHNMTRQVKESPSQNFIRKALDLNSEDLMLYEYVQPIFSKF